MTRITISALALVLAAPMALAEGHSSTELKSIDMTEMEGALIRSRDITGGNIYTMDEATWDATAEYTEIDTNWVNIGEIEDIVLSKDGQMIGLVAEVGGFLDIGDKHVVIPVENVSLVAVDDETYSYVTRYTEEQLEELPSVDEGFWD
ncbi:MAG: PRC-barrel domain-containing protein [Tateyamaria sp.]